MAPVLNVVENKKALTTEYDGRIVLRCLGSATRVLCDAMVVDFLNLKLDRINAWLSHYHLINLAMNMVST